MKESAVTALCLEDLDLYTLFLHLLEKPTADRVPMVMEEGIPAILAELADELDVDRFPEVEVPDSVQDAESRYLSLFEVGLPAPPCPLNESPYNRTEPPTKVIHENLLFYRAFGLDLAPENRELPDHLRNQLEFLSYLTRLQEQAPDENALASVRAGKRDFIQRHVLSWIPKARRKLNDLGDGLYGPVFAVMEAYLRRDLQTLTELPHKVGKCEAG